MTGKPIKTPQQLADEHWDWLQPIFHYIPPEKRDDALLGYLFKTVWMHATKHENERLE